jgi:transposase
MSAPVRSMVTDEAWQEIVIMLDRVKHQVDRTPHQSDRMCIEAVLSVTRMGIPWRDLPKALGHWEAVYNRRWEKRSVWRRLWKGHRGEEYTHAQALLIGSTRVRAHQHTAGALKKTVVRWRRLWDELGVD